MKQALMKKGIVIILCAMIVFSLNGCGKLPDIHIPGNYITSEEHWDPEGFQDFTDFCLYRYDSAEWVEKDTSYQKMTEDDVERIAGYFSNFKEWMEAQNRLDEYSFEESCISAGDYCFVKTKQGQPIGDSVYGQYDNYTVYFFDVESLTLFYIHSNI